jgi:hypothetical protein
MFIVTVLADPELYTVGQQYRALDVDTFGQIATGQMPSGDAVANAMWTGGNATCYGNVFNPTNNTYINYATPEQVPVLYVECEL